MIQIDTKIQIDMKMPEKCYECKFCLMSCHDFVCAITRSEVEPLDGERLDDCPLKEVE